MEEDFSARERYSVVVLCVLALLLFFSPLLTIQVPMAGEQQVTGYDVISRIDNMRRNLQGNESKEQAQDDTPTIPRQRKGEPVALPKAPPELPLSVRLAWMIPGAIIIAWTSAVVTMIGFSDPNIAKVSSAVGTCAAICAVAHISIMNSDVHSWFAESMRTSQADTKDNPFGAIAENFGNLIANAFQMKAGWGLYALALFLGLSAFFSFSRMLYSSPPPEPSYGDPTFSN